MRIKYQIIIFNFLFRAAGLCKVLIIQGMGWNPIRRNRAAGRFMDISLTWGLTFYYL